MRQILELAAAGKSQTDIAGLVECHQSTVSRTLAEWADSRGMARRYAESKLLESGGNQLIVLLGSLEQPLQPPGVGPDVLI